jgi:geranylgeranyl pyrophosphate synthase
VSAEATSYDLEAHLARSRAGVEAALERVLADLAPRLSPVVAAAVRHGVLSEGKRLRPILCVSAFSACGGRSGPAAFELAASLEMIHAYSLMHDDLPSMDDADLRRGRPSTHREHGEGVTMRAGAALIPAAALQARRASLALGNSAEWAGEIAGVLMRAAGAGGMVGGQWLDLLAEGEALDEEALDGLHERKTGALLAAAPLMGGMAAGAEEHVLDALHLYGRGLGLAFQITDDVLDATQSAETLGKNPSDAALAKATYVTVHGLAEARERASGAVERALAALDRGGVDAPALDALARYAVGRDN